jgi:hypothetical protein
MGDVKSQRMFECSIRSPQTGQRSRAALPVNGDVPRDVLVGRMRSPFSLARLVCPCSPDRSRRAAVHTSSTITLAGQSKFIHDREDWVGASGQLTGQEPQYIRNNNFVSRKGEV